MLNLQRIHVHPKPTLQFVVPIAIHSKRHSKRPEREEWRAHQELRSLHTIRQIFPEENIQLAHSHHSHHLINAVFQLNRTEPLTPIAPFSQQMSDGNHSFRVFISSTGSRLIDDSMLGSLVVAVDKASMNT